MYNILNSKLGLQGQVRAQINVELDIEDGSYHSNIIYCIVIEIAYRLIYFGVILQLNGSLMLVMIMLLDPEKLTCLVA